MDMKARIPRRTFLTQAAAAATAAGLAGCSQNTARSPKGLVRTRRSISPNDKIRLGVIGVGAQGGWNLGQLLEQKDAEVVAISDVWKERLDRALARCGGNAQGYHDYRELLAREDIDAVLIATVPHWHALMAIDAAEAGKDFYVEKPMTLGVGEGLAVMRAARKHGCITQVGTQIHATSNYRKVVNIIRSGAIGKVSTARTFHVFNLGPEGIGHPPETAVPAGLDWDRWLGPGPARSFNPLLAQDASVHSSFMAYTGGWTPGMAPHIIDLVFWALDLGYPLSATSSGGRYVIRDCGDAYDTHEALWQFPDFTLQWTTSMINSYAFDFQGGGGTGRKLGIYLQGVDGTLITDYGNFRIVPEGDRMKGVDVEAAPKVVGESPGHHREWLDGIRTRTQPSACVDYHVKIDVALNLSLLSLKLGRTVAFDSATETIPNDAEARKYLVPQYRAPWRFPSEYL